MSKPSKIEPEAGETKDKKSKYPKVEAGEIKASDAEVQEDKTVETKAQEVTDTRSDAEKKTPDDKGESASTLAKEKKVLEAVNAALKPVGELVWGVEKIEKFVHDQVSQKLKDVPVENIKTPDPMVAATALDSIRYMDQNSLLCGLYVNLLATAINQDIAKTVRPSFVEIIKNISSDEALVLQFIVNMRVVPIIDITQVTKDGSFERYVYRLVSLIGVNSGCEVKESLPEYLINLERLGIVVIPRGVALPHHQAYDNIVSNPWVVAELNKLNEDNHQGRLDKYYVGMSSFGDQFVNACFNRVKTTS